MAAQPVDGQVLAVQIDMGTEMRGLRALDRHIVMASLAALAVVVPLAALAAELPNRRLRRVARTARRIADGDLDARTRWAAGRRRDHRDLGGRRLDGDSSAGPAARASNGSPPMWPTSCVPR